MVLIVAFAYRSCELKGEPSGNLGPTRSGKEGEK